MNKNLLATVLILNGIIFGLLALQISSEYLKRLELKMTKSQNNSFELEAFEVFKRRFKYCTITFFMF